MSFSYQPLSEKECEEARNFVLLEPGIYDYHVKTANAKQSKSGNPMIELILEIKDKEGTPHNIFDYLVSTKGMAWKIRHFCKSAGLESEYDLGNFDEFQARMRKGKVLIALEKGSEKPEGGFYKDKNTVEDYVYDNNSGDPVSSIPQKTDPFSDDLPF